MFNKVFEKIFVFSNVIHACDLKLLITVQNT